MDGTGAVISEAKKRFGLCVLDYIVTCNHIHLLVKDTGPNVIAESMQLINTEARSKRSSRSTARSVQDVKNSKIVAGHSNGFIGSSGNAGRKRLGREFDVVKSELSSKAIYRAVEHSERDYTLREQGEAYNDDLSGKNPV